jgi:hypothetical protein
MSHTLKQQEPTPGHTVGGGPPDAIDDDLPSLQHVLDDARFRDPLSVFDFAWLCEKGQDPGLVLYLGQKFSKFLEARCELKTPVPWPLPSVTRDRSAMWWFVATISMLLDKWRGDPPADHLPGSVGARWCEQHPDILQNVQTAQRARTRYSVVGEEDWTISELMAGTEMQQKKKPALLWKDELSGQRTWVQAARTLAYVVFGDFLASDTQKLGFCQRCGRPFDRGKKKLFCSSGCAHAESATVSRHDTKANKRHEGMLRSAKKLSEWLEKKHRTGSDWRSVAELAFKLPTSDGRYSRLMGEYIRASQTSPGSPEREKLLRSLLTSSTETPHQRENVQQQLEGFLQVVAKAESRAKARKPL